MPADALLPRRSFEQIRRDRRRASLPPAAVRERVAAILSDVASEGDPAVVRWAQRLDGAPPDPASWWLGEGRIDAAWRAAPATLRADLETAAARVRAYHRSRIGEGPGIRMLAPDDEGYRLGERIAPVDRAGIYVPAGSAPLVSTVLMAALVAVEAGVADVTIATPAPGGQVDGAILAACRAAGVRAALSVGGAQAVGALAFGTETIAPVDVIAGPGGVWVTEAKRQVFGIVGIDGIAGPSEVLVVADAGASPQEVAADLLAQAEHDRAAWPVLVAVGEEVASRILAEVQRQLDDLPRREMATEALRLGATVVAPDVATAVAWAGSLAPEHLELAVADPERHLAAVGAAGAIFLGHLPEALGDYVAGPSHVLPTAGAARFSSPLGVEAFWRRTSLIGAAPGMRPWAGESAAAAARLARLEGLEGHARAVDARLAQAPLR